MRIIVPCSRTRVVVSAIVGLTAFLMQTVSVWRAPTGDEPSKINEANVLLEQFRLGQQTEGTLYTVTSPDGRQMMIFAHTVLTQSRLAKVFDVFPGKREHKIVVEIPEYNTTDEYPEGAKPEEIEAALRKKFPPEKVAIIRQWEDIEAASRGLTSSNGQILKARAMQYLEVNPGSFVESYEWKNRFEFASRSFGVCTKAERIWRSLGFGGVAFVISATLSWLAFLTLSWVWRLLPDRPGEVSPAIPGEPHRQQAEASGAKLPWIQHGVLASVCLLVIGVYACTAHEGAVTQLSLNAASSYYNLLVQSFRAGQLNLKKEVPPGLAQLADPYTPTLLRPNGVMDLSYYRGKLYLYFGVTPAVMLFWPYVALTGHYLFYRQAMTIFCAVGFLASVGILRGLWRRYFPEVSVAVVAAVRSGAWLGCIPAAPLGSVRGLGSGDQLRVYADDAGAGRHLVCVTGDGAGVGWLAAASAGVRAGSGGATKFVVRCDYPAGTSGPSVA